MFQMARFFSCAAVSRMVRVKPSHAAFSRSACNGSIDAEPSGTWVASGGIAFCSGRSHRLAQTRPLVAGQYIELCPVDRQPVVLENPASVSRVGVPGPIRIAESAGFQKLDEASLPRPFLVVPHGTAAKFADEDRGDAFRRQVCPMAAPDRRQIPGGVWRGKPELRVDVRAIVVRGVDQLIGAGGANRGV